MAARFPSASIFGLTFWLVMIGGAANAWSAPPVLTGLSPRGWKPGENEISIQGANFTPTTRLLMEIPGSHVVLKPETTPTANQMQFLVTLPDNVPPGVHELRLFSEEGLSPPALVMIDSFPNIVEKEPNNDTAQAQPLELPTALEGRLGGVESDLIQFEGKAGQRIVAELVARRLGCNMKPVLRLLNEKRLELQVSRPQQKLGGDPRIIATLPADGKYFLEIHDLVYRGDNGQYRLLVGDLQVADNVFPVAAQRGQELPLQFFGGTVSPELRVTTRLDASPRAEFLGVTLPPGPLASPLPISLTVSDHPEITEAEPTPEEPQLLTIPIGVSGRLLLPDTSQPGETDRYRITGTPGSVLRIAIQAASIGSPADIIVKILKPDGALLMTQDDSPGSPDPDFLYTFPADVATVDITVADVHGRGGREFVYHLEVLPAPDGDFDLELLTPLVQIPAGGTASVRVRANRRNHTAAIRLGLKGELPAGVQLKGAEIPEGVTDTFLSISVPADAAVQAGKYAIVGESGPADQPTLVRFAKTPVLPPYVSFPWMRNQLPVATTTSAPLTLNVETTQEKFLRGMEYSAKVIAHRSPEQSGVIKLIGTTSQVPAPGQGQIAPVANLTIPAGMNEGVIKFNVPINAPEQSVSFLLQGQLLDAKENKTVVATVESPVELSTIAFPFRVEIEPLPLRRGVRNLLKGKLVRESPFEDPVEVAITGIPGNFRTTKLTIPANATEFEFPILVPPLQAPAPLANLKITGSRTAAPVLNTTPQDIPLEVTADEPPPVLEIFDDGPDFRAALTEGSGTAELFAEDVYAGKESLQIKGAEKQRAALPGLGVAIAETPGPGQFRYLRFAWKKKGGTAAVLQLANGNQFGSASTKQTDFRYLAGQAPADSKAVPVAEQIPEEWTVVTRDLFADHGPFTLTGIGVTAQDGEFLLLDHVYLAKTEADFPPAPEKPAE